jgi:RNA ligase
LNQILDTEKLSEHVKNGYVNIQTHKSLPLRIFNYSHLAQFEKSIWGDGVIDLCRGLIVDDKDVVVARPFKKFWNLGTAHAPESMEENLPKCEPTVLEKLDGSLGILFQYDNYTGVATRGSFHSPQADWANEWVKMYLNEKLKGPFRFPEDYTPLFEIIYPENRIVCKYDYEGLVLLGFVHKATGYEMEHGAAREIAMKNGLRIAEDHTDKTLEDLLVSEDQGNREGYVVSYHTTPTKPPVKVKIKFADYVRLHRIVTGMNPKSVWEMLSSGGNVDALLEDTPEHFQKWLQRWRTTLVDKFYAIYDDALTIFRNRPWKRSEWGDKEYRKECALYFKRYPSLCAPLFRLLDNDTPGAVSTVWKMIKPKCNEQDTFRKDGE